MRTYVFRFSRRWLGFFAALFIFAIILSLRSIPDLASSNDTGRYLFEFRNYCEREFDSEGFREFGMKAFFFLFSAACYDFSGRIFLFLSSVVAPISLGVLATRRAHSRYYAYAFVLSVFGIELMTNALRQAAAMSLFFIGIFLVNKGRARGFLAISMAGLIHISAVLYAPIAVLLGSAILGPLLTASISVSAAVVAIVVLFGFVAGLSLAPLELYSLLLVYKEIYSGEVNYWFILYMILPLFHIYAVRVFFDKSSVTRLETQVFAFSCVICLAFSMLFPVIAFRLILFAVPLQMFAAMISPHGRSRASLFALVGIIIHHSIMFFYTDHYSALFHG